jgi:hypothetical protein
MMVDLLFFGLDQCLLNLAGIDSHDGLEKLDRFRLRALE